MIILKRVDNGIVFSNDIYKIMNGQNALDFNYRKNGLIIPNEEQIQILRNDFKKDVNRIFGGKVTIFDENEMEQFLYDSLADCEDYPIISLDKIYLKEEGDSIFYLDCTRLEGTNKLVSRGTLHNQDSVERQIKEISQKLKQIKRTDIVLVDDVVFSGNVIRTIIENFAKNGIKVNGVRAAISTEESFEFFNNNLEMGLKCGCLLGKDVIDQVCERDFYFGIAQSGISIKNSEGKIIKAPYFKPFGDPEKRASIPKEYEDFFSNGCLMRSMYLWKCIEENSNKNIYIKDLPEEIIDTKENERVLHVLRKGLIYDEKITNRNNGECR